MSVTSVCTYVFIDLTHTHTHSLTVTVFICIYNVELSPQAIDLSTIQNKREEPMNYENYEN